MPNANNIDFLNVSLPVSLSLKQKQRERKNGACSMNVILKKTVYNS